MEVDVGNQDDVVTISRREVVRASGSFPNLNDYRLRIRRDLLVLEHRSYIRKLYWTLGISVILFLICSLLSEFWGGFHWFSLIALCGIFPSAWFCLRSMATGGAVGVVEAEFRRRGMGVL